MEKQKALKIAVIASLVGIALLFIISKFAAVKPVNIDKIDESFVGRTVFIEGEVSRTAFGAERTMIFMENSSLPIIVFSNISIPKGTRIVAEGKVEEYKDNLQINADKVEIRTDQMAILK